MRLHPLAIFLGTVTELVLSLTIGPFELYFFGINANSPYLFPASLILGLVAVAVGGYVTALKSPSSKVSNTIIFAVIQLLLGALVVATVAMPLWFNVASFILVIPAALFGAYLASKE